jgi:tripartite-type tricarboxylate transporter receptor subunit TctC
LTTRGAGGSLGTAAIAKAAPDGYTIGMGTASTLQSIRQPTRACRLMC